MCTEMLACAACVAIILRSIKPISISRILALALRDKLMTPMRLSLDKPLIR